MHRRRWAAVLSGRPSVVRIGLELPAFALSAGLMVLLAGIFGFWPRGALLICAWVASGPMILIRKVEETIMSGREGLRRPTGEELQRLAAAWSVVTKAAGVDPTCYTVWVQKSQRINAFATAGHTVAVTEEALRILSPTQLEAILAHELGHHLDGHVHASLLRYWYSLPALYVFQFATYLNLAITSALASGSTSMSVAICLVAVGLLGFLLVSIPVLGLIALVFVVVPFGLLWVRRAQEHQADAIAAELGYGAALARLLLAATPVNDAEKPSRSSWRNRIGDTHPSNLDRVRRLESLGATKW